MKLVLVVEDEHGLAEVVQLILEANGYRVAVASNGQAALDLLATGERPAVILTDFMMPHMTGGEMGQAIRADPILRDTPIIISSATSEVVIHRAFADYDAFLRKPYAVEGLLALIAGFVATGRQPLARQADVDVTMKHLLKGIELPGHD